MSYEVPGYLHQHVGQLIGMDTEAAAMRCRPSFILRPRLFIDGNQWCALYGENVQDGLAGFGDSPDAAYAAFDAEWFTKLPAKRPLAEEGRG